MEPFLNGAEGGHEQVVLCHDAESGLRAIIAIHDTALGPALGGVRQWQFASDGRPSPTCCGWRAAMTYKAAVAGLEQGGGKTVVIGAPGSGDERAFRALGRFIDRLGGRYIAAEDVGTSPREMECAQPRDAVGDRRRSGEHGGSGDPSPLTAIGVSRACAPPAQRRSASRSGRQARSSCRAAGTSARRSCGCCSRPAPTSSAPTSTPSAPSALEREGATAVPLDGTRWSASATSSRPAPWAAR